MATTTEHDGGAAAGSVETVAAEVETSGGGGSAGEISSVEELAAALADEEAGAGGSDGGGTDGTEGSGKQEADPEDGSSGNADESGKDDGPEAKATDEDDEAKAKAAAEEEKRLNDEAAEKHPAFQKRIDQLVRQREEREEKLVAEQARAAGLEQELAATKQRLVELERGGAEANAQAQGVSALFLAGSQQELDAKRGELTSLVQWCRSNADGGSLGGQELDADQVAAVLEQAEGELVYALPDAMKALAGRERMRGYAAQQYPAYFGEKAAVDGAGVMRSLMTRAPGLARVEQLPVMVGDMLAGAALRKLGLVPGADGKSLVDRDGKPAWTAEGAKSSSAKAIVADALRERKSGGQAGAGASAGTIGRAATGAPSSGNAAKGGSGPIQTEEQLAAELAG